MVYVISNVYYPEDKKLIVEEDDLLVFLNKSLSIAYYQDHAKKMMIRRSPNESYGKDIDGVDTMFIYESTPDNTVDSKIIEEIKSTYNWDYPIAPGKRRCATTGYMAVKFLSYIYPVDQITLVNFGYNVSESTYRCPYHNWEYEDSQLSGYRHIYTADQIKEEPPKKITIVTLTADRPTQFKELVTCVHRQTQLPFSWVILDNGKTPIRDLVDTIKVPYTYIRYTKKAWLSTKLGEALSYVPSSSDIVTFMSDDNYYPPKYLRQVNNMMHDYNMLGSRNTYNYNLDNSYDIPYSSKHSYIHFTSISTRIIDKVMDILMGMNHNRYIYKLLWKASDITDKILAIFPVDSRVIRLLNWNIGRPGIETEDHQIAKANDDHTKRRIKEWLGEDFNRYERYIHKHAI